MGKDNSVTIAKGVGIILVVLGHCGIPIGRDFIYMFHMPLFFILAGYCFKIEYLSDFKRFFYRRVKGLYLPFVKYGLIFLLLHNFFYYLNIYNGEYGYKNAVSHLYDLKETVVRAIYTLLFTSCEELLGGYWFLPQLFYASVLGWLTLKYLQNAKISGIIFILILSILCNLFGLYIPNTSISWLSVYATAFFLFGHLMHHSKIDFKLWHLIAAVTIVLLGQFYWCTGMPGCSTVKQIPYFISGFSGTIMILIISKYILSLGNIISTIFILIGNHTLEILTWHFLSFKLVNLLTVVSEKLPIEMLAMFPTIEGASWPHWWIIHALVGVCLPCIIVIITNKTKEYWRISPSFRKLTKEGLQAKE